ncbi:AAA family ATPase [Rossellomorea aquimaris]|uniref:ATP-binding protein n=1 Tax=Rossellomorea aquimaris TaxID=189382 RepID=UPI001CD7BBFA|nr:AAA family ATPase [Rossellomorea aquimaris]MCA1056482.1 AAA family ATPase [Rossellomorea aquimaris]
MRIIQLQIYGYGKLINKDYELSDQQLFFGENEAGKSTIMSFIHSILFGFPTKQQSQLRYEPKRTSEYGGRLICEFQGVGRVSIERIKGKAAGDVTVHFEDGRTGEDEALSQLLGKMDKTTYQNIFSFNLEGLQDIHKLRRNELNRFLFSAGSTGTDQLLQMEQQWQKEREGLFKKSGRKPIINLKMNELRHLEKQIGEAKDKNKRYGKLLEEKRSLESVISTLEAEKESLSDERDRLLAVEENWEILSEYASITDKLSILNESPYPPNGSERLSELKTEWRQVSASLETLKAKKDKLSEKLHSLTTNHLHDSDKQQLESFLSQQPMYSRWMDESSHYRLEIASLKDTVSETIRELDLCITEEQIPLVNTSLLMNERIEKALQTKSKLVTDHENVTKHLHSESATMDVLEKKCDELEELLIEEEDYQTLQRTVKSRSSESVVHQQQMWLEHQLESAEKEIHSKRKAFGRQIPFTAAVTIILLAFSIWTWMSDNGMGTILSLLIIALVAYQGLRSRKELNEKKNQLHLLRKKAKELPRVNKDDEGNPSVVEHQETILREQMEYRSEWKQRILQLEEQGIKVDKLKEEEADLSRKIEDANRQLTLLKKELYLSPEFPEKWLRDAFVKLKGLLRSYESLQKLRDEHSMIHSKLDVLTSQCKEWFNLHSLGFTNMDEAFHKMKNMMQDVEKKRLISEQVQSDLEPLRLEIEQTTIHLENVNRDTLSLFEEAGCKDETEFRRLAMQEEERKNLLARYEGMRTRINNKTLSSFDEFHYREDVTKHIKGVAGMIEDKMRDLSQRYKKLASVKHEITLLEEGKSYSRLLQEFQDKKSEIQEDIHRWSQLTLAQNVLNHTIEHYQRTKLPNVIKLAEEHFSILTKGAYTSIYVTDEEMIEVEREDGMRYHAVELSQGTKEQLYISIRFALVRSFKEQYPLPLLIDDGAVNFDSERTEAFIQLLRNMGSDHQVILFTCHPHVKNFFQTNETIHLERALSV